MLHISLLAAVQFIALPVRNRCRGIPRSHDATNVRQSLIARNERDLAGLDLRDPPPNFDSLSCCDVRWHVVGQTLQDTVGEFRPLRSGKLLCLFENVGDGLGHGMRI